MSRDEYEPINALPRIIQRDSLEPDKRLVDLEHVRLHMRLTGEAAQSDFCAHHWWRLSEAPLTAAMQSKHPFRQSKRKQLDLRLMPDDDGEAWALESLDRDGNAISAEYMMERQGEISFGPRVSLWAEEDYLRALRELAEELELPLKWAAAKFGTVRLDELGETQVWRYHPVLGFRRAGRGE